jgi:hypothetical protein
MSLKIFQLLKILNPPFKGGVEGFLSYSITSITSTSSVTSIFAQIDFFSEPYYKIIVKVKSIE